MGDESSLGLLADQAPVNTLAELFEYIEVRRQRVEEMLLSCLAAPDPGAAALYKAMRYSVLNGGKRIRAMLCIAAAEFTLGPDAAAIVLPAACALELIHSASLIHDDLPALDDDDLRRGQPSCHIRFDEATAILAGDALLVEAFRLASLQAQHSPADRVVRVVRLLADASREMAVGELHDLKAEGQNGDAVRLAYISNAKTGALIRASLLTGAILAAASDSLVQALERYGTSLGTAFQAVDDILNEEGGPSLGKPAGTDRQRGKLTYPAVFGLEASRRLAREQADSALAALVDQGPAAAPLRAMTRFVLERSS